MQRKPRLMCLWSSSSSFLEVYTCLEVCFLNKSWYVESERAGLLRFQSLADQRARSMHAGTHRSQRAAQQGSDLLIRMLLLQQLNTTTIGFGQGVHCPMQGLGPFHIQKACRWVLRPVGHLALLQLLACNTTRNSIQRNRALTPSSSGRVNAEIEGDACHPGFKATAGIEAVKVAPCPNESLLSHVFGVI